MPYPIAFEIWNAYLSKFIKRYVRSHSLLTHVDWGSRLTRHCCPNHQGGEKLERARDLFEQALESCPPKFCKPIYLLYGKLEEDHGLAKRAMAVYDRATRAVEAKDRMEVSPLFSRLAFSEAVLTHGAFVRLDSQMFTYYIAKATANFGLPATRPIYERAIEQLPDAQTAEMCLRFAALERKLGEIDRARAVFAHASQFCDPRVRFPRPFFCSSVRSLTMTHLLASIDEPRFLGTMELVRDRDWFRRYFPRSKSLCPSSLDTSRIVS